jgi:N-acetyl sugar amidotransferase
MTTTDADYGKPLFDHIRYCVRCCFPETLEGFQLDEMGICRSCQSSEQKIHIDWVEREKELRSILERAKATSGANYDCIIPISGGKDSMFQLHVLTKVYGMKPLAVTFNHNWYSETGWYNLMNSLDKFNVDHIMYTPNRNLVNRIARRSLGAIGDSCWHCHAGVGAFPLHAAAKFKIPLLVWGESIADSSGKASYKDQQTKFDRDYFTKVSAKLRPHQMECDYLSEKDLHLFNPPSVEEIEEAGVFGIHLGDYLFWDDERQTEFLREHYDWKETEMEGTYKGYKSVECIMPGVHDFTCYLKRGFGRATWHSSADVRAGLLTREEAFEQIKKHDPEVPSALGYYLEVTGIGEQEFYDTMKGTRVDKMKDTELPVRPRQRPNREVTRPFVEQLLEKHRGRKDPRESE